MAKKSRKKSSSRKPGARKQKSKVQQKSEESFRQPTRRGAGNKGKELQKAAAPKRAGPTMHQGSQVPGEGAGPDSRQDQEVRLHQERQSPGTVSQPAYGTQRLPDDLSDREKRKVMPDEER